MPSSWRPFPAQTPMSSLPWSNGSALCCSTSTSTAPIRSGGRGAGGHEAGGAARARRPGGPVRPAAGVLTSIVDGMRAWLQRQSVRSMKLTLDCDSLEVTGISSEEQDHSSRTGSLELPPPLTPRRLVLIAATSDYRDPTLHGLRAPGTDAEAVAEVLGEPDAIASRTPGSVSRLLGPAISPYPHEVVVGWSIQECDCSMYLLKAASHPHCMKVGGLW